MKTKLLLITALLASGIAYAFGQGGAPMVTPTPPTLETFAFVTDGTNSRFPLQWAVFLPPTATPRPAVLVIFGGEFKEGNRSYVYSYAAQIAAQGFVALAIDYRTDLPNNFTMQQTPVYAPPANPNQPGDVKMAVSAARTGLLPSPTPGTQSIIYGRITGKVGAVGGSSGASHALWCAATGSLSTDRLDAAVLFSGAYKFDDNQSLGWQGDPSCTYLNGINFCPDVSRYCQVIPPNCTSTLQGALHAGSPIYQVGADGSIPSPLYWVSDPGDLITPFQYWDLAAVIESLHLGPPAYTGVMLTGCGHGFENWQAQKTAVIHWLQDRLY